MATYVKFRVQLSPETMTDAGPVTNEIGAISPDMPCEVLDRTAKRFLLAGEGFAGWVDRTDTVTFQ